MAINHLIRAAMTNSKDRPRYGYLAPLFRQAKDVAWDYLQHYSRPIPGIVINQSELRIDYPNGSRIRLYGCDTPDTLRGIYLDGVVLDEYAQMPRNLLGEVIRPALSDRRGWAMFIGTPKGRDAFCDLYHQSLNDPDWHVVLHRASETGIIYQDELASAKKMMSDDEYAQEYECSWDAAVQGAYYSKQLQQARDDGRVCNVPHEPQLTVDTWWDLGIGDATSIIFTQSVGREIRIIDYYESSGDGLPDYVRYLQSKPYIYGQHNAPHDIQVRELGTGVSRIETAARLGVNFSVVPRLSVDDGIDAARALFSRCWFDQVKCSQLIDALGSYRKEWDDKRREFKSKPRHDWTSHAADAFRYLSVGWSERYTSRKPRQMMDYGAQGWLAA